MSKKIEISIYQLVIYFLVLFVLAGLLIYKSFIEPGAKSEPEEQVEEVVPEEEPVREKKRPKTPKEDPKVPENDTLVIDSDSLNSIVEKEGLEGLTDSVIPSKEEDLRKRAELLHIHRTRSLFHEENLNIDVLPEGKIYYEGEFGKLESILIRKDSRIVEKLISKDNSGQTIHELEIGLINEDQSVAKYALLHRNRISVFELLPTKKGDKSQESVTDYTITPDMKFVKGKTYTKVL